MRIRLATLPFLVVLSACAGVAVRPDDVRATDLAVVELTAEQAQRVRELVDEAIEAMGRHQYAEARSAAAAALQIDERAARARAILGLTEAQQASQSTPPDHVLIQAAEADARLARQLAPDDPFVTWTHALLLAQIGHTSAAAEAAERASQMAHAANAQERAALLTTAATYRYELGEERAALPILQAHAELQPANAATQFRLGVSLLRIAAVPIGPKPASLLAAQRRAEDAAKAFARCAEASPNDDDAALAIAAALWRAADLADERNDATVAGEHRQATVASLRTTAARFPTNAEAWFRLGVTAEKLGPPEAAPAYEQALARDPNHVGALLNLAALRVTDAPATAKALWQRALTVDAESRQLTARERRRISDLVERG
jgi:hypothetical protein